MKAKIVIVKKGYILTACRLIIKNIILLKCNLYHVAC